MHVSLMNLFAALVITQYVDNISNISIRSCLYYTVILADRKEKSHKKNENFENIFYALGTVLVSKLAVTNTPGQFWL
jgi:hypothetical protein